MSLLKKHANDLPSAGRDAEGASLVTGVRLARRWSMAEDMATLQADWKLAQTGSGTVQQVAGTLQLSSGAAANGMASALLATMPMLCPVRIAVIAKFSAANPVNCDASIELVDADGAVWAAWSFAGALNSTQTRIATFGAGPIAAPENGTALVISDRVAAARIYEMQLYQDEIRFCQRDPNTANARNTLGIRSMYVPDPNMALYLRVRMQNGAVAPASAPVLTLQGVIVNDINEVPVDLTNTGSSSAAESVPVSITGTPNVNAVNNPSAYLGGYLPTHQSVLAATTNPVLVRNGAINVGGGSVANTSAADIWLKLYNKNAVPLPASDIPVLTVRVPAGQQVSLKNFIPSQGLRLTAGLAYLVTGAASKTDTTAIAAGSVIEIMGV